MMAASELVVLDWKDLVNNSNDDYHNNHGDGHHDEESCSNKRLLLASAIESAFGHDGLGIIAIRNMPGFVEAKADFLPLAHRLVTLPSKYLETNLTDPVSLYNAGWSYGKEKLGDEPDYAKGSFYYNPMIDLPGTEEDRIQYPYSYPQNIWPDEERIPLFKEKAMRIGQLLKNVVVALCKHIDYFAHNKNPNYPINFLHQALKDTDKVKARMLYYFPLNETITKSVRTKEDSWIGWHNDSGFLTAHAGDMYIDHQTGIPVDCPDPEAGLYIVDRHDQLHRVIIPPDCVAVQMGECTQIVTGGVVLATPHCVRAVRPSMSIGAPNIARISLPCFVDTPPGFELSTPKGYSRKDVLGVDGMSSHRIPSLNDRWTHDGMSFGSFLQKSFQVYYDWTVNGV